MARKAEMKLQRALAASRRRASALRKQYKSEPITDALTVTIGGAAAGIVPAYLPAGLKNIAGLPFPAVAGLGLVVYSSMGRGAMTKQAGQLGQGMLAVAAAELAKNYV